MLRPISTEIGTVNWQTLHILQQSAPLGEPLRGLMGRISLRMSYMNYQFLRAIAGAARDAVASIAFVPHKGQILLVRGHP